VSSRAGQQRAGGWPVWGRDAGGDAVMKQLNENQQQWINLAADKQRTRSKATL
jgi:hypothetical protein